MKERLKQRIIDLASIIGLSGYEWDVARYLYNELKDHVDMVDQLGNGTLVMMKRGAKPGPKVMISAHMDEVGFVVSNITDDGYLLFEAIGLATIACIPARRVLVKTRKGDVIPGVIGTRSGHLLSAEQKSKVQTTAQSYVDIYVSSREEAEELGVGRGTVIVPDSPPTCVGKNGDYIISRALDDRAQCAVMAELIRLLHPEDICGEVYFIFNVLEEPTISAIHGALEKYPCDYGIFLDTIPCGDVPDVNAKAELPIFMRKGPAIVFSQQVAAANFCAMTHPKILDALEDAARLAGIEWQEYAISRAGYCTDAVMGVLSGRGMAIGSVGIPRRYSHSPSEVMHVDDAVAEVKMLHEFLKRPVDLNMLQ